ncbi:MAG: hypothetical protein J6B07_01925 [Opitutales bacterium]|nr:hypothetical protein [Opitutales bacterium]
MQNKGFLQTSIPPNWQVMTADKAQSDIRTALEQAKENLDEIKSRPDELLTFDNTIRALDRAFIEINRAWTYLNHLESVMTSPELRNALNELMPEVSNFFSSILLDDILFAKISTFAKTPEATNLQGEEKILFEETLKDFQEEGANLPQEKKQRLKEINLELSLKGQKFSENELDSTKEYFLHITNENDLQGLPQTAIEIASKTAKTRGLSGWVFTLDRPSYAPFMCYADNDNLRKQLWEASTKIATSQNFDNRPIIREILKLREEKAQILSFKNYADYTLSRRMARNGKIALNFIEKLRERFYQPFLDEWKNLEAFAKTQGCNNVMP